MSDRPMLEQHSFSDFDDLNLTPGELAERERVSRRTVRRWRLSGEGPRYEMAPGESPAGYVHLARRIFEHALWKEPREFSRFEAWLDMIQAAAISPHARMVGSSIIEIDRGEMLASLRFLALRWGWTKKKVEVFLRTLIKKGQISGQRETSEGTIYHLVNYDTYNRS